MVRLIVLFSSIILLLPSAVRAAAAATELPRGSWSCVMLDPSHLALTGDYFELQNKLFRKRLVERRKASWARRIGWGRDLSFDFSGTEAIAAYRPQVAAMLSGRPAVKIASTATEPLAVASTGYWMNPIGQARFTDDDGSERLSRNADVAHYLFLTLSRPLAEGETVTITLPAGEKVEYTRNFDTPSPLFKFNQLGYLPQAPKYAYIGAWLGTAGPLPLHKALDGKEFHLVSAAERQRVFSGTLRARMPDPTNAEGVPFSGEEVLELDFSTFRDPGTYYLLIPGIGRSHDFRIGDDTMAEAFFIHARGLFHQRCGIAKTEPFTHWIQKPCHLTCIRGSFPPEITDYSPGRAPRNFGFTEGNKPVEVNHFALIKQNPPTVPEELHAPGGWHDAADFDRRPQHLSIVGDLAMVYLLKPENFCDGQLNLPESGNGIPDILDEAKWGLEHLRLKQQSDGGVGTWVETSRHPRPGEGMASDDKLTYYLSCATRNSSLEYAAYASLLALAMRKAGEETVMEQFRESARKAWDFAMSPIPEKPRVFYLDRKVLFYRENPELAPEFLVKAGFNLFLLTGNETYLQKAESAAKDAGNAMRIRGWRWSPMIWMELDLFSCDSHVLNKLRVKWRRSIIEEANTRIDQQENAYPIRVPWFGPRGAWVHSMAWGTFHPLVRARILIAAHAMTGDSAYLDGALLANDFHNGANPFGSTMTSGLGRVYPVRFLDLNSYADGIPEAIPGITPFRNTYGIPRGAIKMGYGLFYSPRPGQQFAGLSLSIFPRPGLKEGACAKEISRLLPIWRRWCNVESETVDASEFSVWETIGPAAAVTGYLLNGAGKPDPRWIARKPVDDVRKLPGYAPLP